MLSLTDERWSTLNGGYGLPYDPRPALQRLANHFLDSAAWQELWEEAHHQGDVGEVSYALVPYLVNAAAAASVRDWNVYSLVATIETERHRNTNPRLPPYLAASYSAAIRQLASLALLDLVTATDPYVLRSALAVVALARGQIKLGAILAHLEDSEINELAENYLAWSELYGEEVEPPSPR